MTRPNTSRKTTGWLRWRSVKSRCGALGQSGAERAVQQRHQFEAPGVTLSRLLCCRTDHTWTDWSRWVDTAPKTERESVPKAASCLCQSVPNLPIGRRASRLPERWSDGLFLGSSEFHVGTVLRVVRARSVRRRPLGERATVELLHKLVGVPWQQVPGDPDATAVPTVISAEPFCRRR